ncbi:hypothetical protein BDZ91DRAFT_816775 [Kalaharituber pfeilii]|nr:hypothetical protein BDZ91DRAFT_816775 [Kalaharituber pfeilii]
MGKSKQRAVWKDRREGRGPWRCCRGGGDEWQQAAAGCMHSRGNGDRLGIRVWVWVWGMNMMGIGGEVGGGGMIAALGEGGWWREGGTARRVLLGEGCGLMPGQAGAGGQQAGRQQAGRQAGGQAGGRAGSRQAGEQAGQQDAPTAHHCAGGRLGSSPSTPSIRYRRWARWAGWWSRAGMAWHGRAGQGRAGPAARPFDATWGMRAGAGRVGWRLSLHAGAPDVPDQRRNLTRADSAWARTHARTHARPHALGPHAQAQSNAGAPGVPSSAVPAAQQQCIHAHCPIAPHCPMPHAPMPPPPIAGRVQLTLAIEKAGAASVCRWLLPRANWWIIAAGECEVQWARALAIEFGSAI